MNKKSLLFVVQEHHTLFKHYDFRLEMEGVFVSWAVPDGPSINPVQQRMAYLVEDHVYGYKDFEGIIPGADFGSGKVLIWDRGVYEPKGVNRLCNLHENWLSSGILEFTLHGTKLRGDWVITKTDETNFDVPVWLLRKKEDSFAAKYDIVTAAPHSVVSGKTIGEIAEKDGIFDIRNYK